VDSTYTRDLDALLPKLCALSEETGEEHRWLRLREAGLQALASVVISETSVISLLLVLNIV
jgi:hypothetical protein